MIKEKKATVQAGDLGGVIPPVLLPLTSSGAPDYDSLRRHMDYLLAGDVDALWMNGTTGEFFALTEQECAKVVEAAVKHTAGRVPVVAQVGDGSTRRAIVKAEQALGVGADFLAVVMPYYLDYSQAELQRYYEEIFRAVQQPLIIYQIPQTCKVSLTIPSIVELARDGTVMGIKESSGNMEFYRSLVAQVKQQGLSLRCFNGSSALMDISLMAKGHGLVSGISNVLPHLTSRLYRNAVAGEWNAVATIQARINELIQALKLPNRTNLPAPIGTYKWLLRELGTISTDLCFAPFEPLSKTERSQLQERALPLAQELCKDLLPGHGVAVRRPKRSEAAALSLGKG